jgi:elongation factor 1-alpha
MCLLRRKHLISCLAYTDCAILNVAATTGEFESGFCRSGQTREHLLLAFTLGIKYLIIAVNKMDATDSSYSEARFEEIKTELSRFVKISRLLSRKYCFRTNH